MIAVISAVQQKQLVTVTVTPSFPRHRQARPT